LWLPVAEQVFRHAATPQTWELRVRAAALSLGRDAALYGPTAARWWSLDAGVRTTTATRTIIDLAASRHPADSIEKAIDSAIRLRLTSIPRLTRRMAELAPGRSGIQLLRELLLDSGGESFLERRFLRLTRSARLPRPTCQVVYATNGRAMRVDFEFTHTNVVVEVSGRLGHTSDRDRQKDACRRNALQQLGKTVLEFTTVDVLSSPDYVLATLHTSGVVTR
jgi:very-short-patch-repair endonuclease